MAQFSDEAKDCGECKNQGFTMSTDKEWIVGPGKFEGEALSTYHAYHALMDGFADENDGPSWRVGNVVCVESSDGLVYGEAFPTEADAITSWEDNSVEVITRLPA